jgi:HEPN domain-containing protein
MTTDPAEKDIKSWVDASRYDLETARALFKSRRYLYVLFMCQQALEKLLKARVTAQTREFPPRIHNLARLGELAGFEFSQEEKTLLERLSLYYLQSRYPPDVRALARTVRRSMAADYLGQTETLWKRVRRRLVWRKSSGRR